MDSDVYARAGGGRSSGSRGFSSGRSYNRITPPSSPHINQPVKPQTPYGAQPNQPVQTPSFGRSLLYGIGGGLIGSAIGSMLFGNRGYAGNQGWGGGGFGDILIILVIVIAGGIYFIVKRYREHKQEMQVAGMAGPSYGQQYTYPAYSEPTPEQTMSDIDYENHVTFGLRHIKELDPTFDENRFKEQAEDMFFKIQSAWTRRDLTSIQNIVSPQLLKSFKEEIDEYIEKGWVNRLENIAIRQVEIVDAAQSHGEEYITVKFLASLLDYKVDEKTNQVISGSTSEPVKFHEYWTFQRNVGEKNWVLGGITQESDYYNKDYLQ